MAIRPPIAEEVEGGPGRHLQGIPRPRPQDPGPGWVLLQEAQARRLEGLRAQIHQLQEDVARGLAGRVQPPGAAEDGPVPMDID